MFDTWYDGPSGLEHGHTGSSLGQEYLINDAGHVSVAQGQSQGPGGGSSLLVTGASTPAPTLVGANGIISSPSNSSGLKFDLIWDSSVASAPSGFMQAVIDVAQYYAKLYSNNIVINLEVGWGEIAGSAMASNALGESESYGYVGNYYSLITNALKHDGYSFSAANEPQTSQFWINTAEAKAMGLVGGSTVGTSSLDGYIGFSTLSGTGYSWNVNATVGASNTGTASNQIDLQAVIQHEISEVMGRIGMEGQTISGHKTYTPLDLFDFSSSNHLELSGSGGYFSTNNGTTHLGNFNNASAYGGDIADWASATSPNLSGTTGLPSGFSDAFNAFGWPGNAGLSQSDMLELAALGYTLTSYGISVA